MNHSNIYVETVYDHKSRRIRIRPVPGQGVELRWVQFPRGLRYEAGLRFKIELLADRGKFWSAQRDIRPMKLEVETSPNIPTEQRWIDPDDGRVLSF